MSGLFLEGRLRVKHLRGVVTRLIQAEGQAFQTLVVGGEFRPMHGTTLHGSFRLEEPLKLHESSSGQPADGGRRSYELSVAWEPAWDPFSACIFFREGCALLRLDARGEVSVVAGARNRSGGDDGVGQVASFESVRGIVSDGAGVLYVADECRIRKVQLPSSWRASPARKSPSHPRMSEVVVSTILDTQRPLCGLAFDNCKGKSSLVYSSKNAIYRVPLGSGGIGMPVLLAGPGNAAPSSNRPSDQVTFTEIWGMVMDGEGSLFLTDVLYDRSGPCSCLRKLTADGTVTTISKLSCVCFPANILPNGCLALCAVKSVGGSDEDLILAQLGLKPPSYLVPNAMPLGPAPRGTLSGDLGFLLDRQPDGTSDHSIEVAGREFHVHRGILAARSEYFRCQFDNNFCDSKIHQSSLNFADPDAFELVLRYMYTGCVVVPPGKAQAVAELAERLLLEKLRNQALDAVHDHVQAETIVDSMLWADEQGFSQLLGILMEWYLDNQAEIVQRAGDTFSRLETNPALMKAILICTARSAGKGFAR